MRNNENRFFNFEIDQTEKVATRARYASYVQAVRKTVSDKENKTADKGVKAI